MRIVDDRDTGQLSQSKVLGYGSCDFDVVTDHNRYVRTVHPDSAVGTLTVLQAHEGTEDTRDNTIGYHCGTRVGIRQLAFLDSGNRCGRYFQTRTIIEVSCFIVVGSCWVGATSADSNRSDHTQCSVRTNRAVVRVNTGNGEGEATDAHCFSARTNWREVKVFRVSEGFTRLGIRGAVRIV